MVSRLRLLALVPIVGACAGEDVATVSVERSDSGGVTVVENLDQQDRVLDVGVEVMWAVGGHQDDDLPLVDLQRQHVAVGGEQETYVLDIAGGRVIKLSAAGEIVGQLGESGEGPGELGRPLSLDVSPDGIVNVFDAQKGGLVRWTTDGAIVDPRRLNRFPWQGVFAITSEGTLLVTPSTTESGGAEFHLTLDRADSTATWMSIQHPAMESASFPTCGLQDVVAPPYFTPELIWTHQNGVTLASNSAAYEFVVFDPSGKQLVVRRRLPAQEIDRRAAAVEIGGGWELSQMNCTIPAEEAIAGRGMAETLPYIRDLSVGANGEFWVRRNVVGRVEDIVDIFDSRGSYIGSWETGSYFPVAFLAPNIFLDLRKDEYGSAVLTAVQVDEVW